MPGRNVYQDTFQRERAVPVAGRCQGGLCGRLPCYKRLRVRRPVLRHAESAPEPGGVHLGTQRQYEPGIPKERRRLQRAGGKGRLRRRPAVADADVASLAVARGDDAPFLGPCIRALRLCAGVPAASLDSPVRSAIRTRKPSLQAEPLDRCAGLEVSRRTSRTPWPHGRRAPRLATAARAVPSGLRRGGHHLLQGAYGLRWQLQRGRTVRSAPHPG